MASIHIVAVIGSPRSPGATATAVDAVIEGTERAGATTRRIDLAHETMATAVDAIEEAQGVILGSPVYRASHTSLIAQILEQIERGARGETRAPLVGKAVALVLTGASDHHFLATERLRGTLACFFAAQTLSPALYVARHNYTDGKALDEATRELAVLHGRALVELAAAVSASTALSRLVPLI
jgi:FMN reductase